MSRKIPSTKTGDADQEKKLLLPLAHIQQIAGDQVCSNLMLAFNSWLQIPAPKLQEVVEIIAMLFNACLLIDDIQDNSDLRDGIPVAHSIYGIASTINSACYVAFTALERLLDLGKVEAARFYAEQLLQIHRGQGIEIYWRDNYICPSEDQYKQMTIQKTSGFFMLAVKIMQLFSDNKTDFSKLVNIFGLYYQIRNDFCNLTTKEYFDYKGYCEDLTEGKFSFPLIHGITKQPGDSQILNILRQRTQNVEVKKYCVSLLESLGSFQYTREALESLDKEAREEIERLGGNPLMTSLLDFLLTWREDTHGTQKHSQ